MQASYLEAMSRVAHSVTAVTTDGPAGRAGVTVSAMCSVSLEGPAPTLLVCIHKDSSVRPVITENGVFCANLLREDQQGISESFAGRTNAAGGDQFECAQWLVRATGAPVLAGALAAFDCRVLQHHIVGTHHIFVGQVESIDYADVDMPLVYHAREYGGVKKLAKG